MNPRPVAGRLRAPRPLRWAACAATFAPWFAGRSWAVELFAEENAALLAVGFFGAAIFCIDAFARAADRPRGRLAAWAVLAGAVATYGGGAYAAGTGATLRFALAACRHRLIADAEELGAQAQPGDEVDAAAWRFQLLDKGMGAQWFGMLPGGEGRGVVIGTPRDVAFVDGFGDHFLDAVSGRVYVTKLADEFYFWERYLVVD